MGCPIMERQAVKLILKKCVLQRTLGGPSCVQSAMILSVRLINGVITSYLTGKLDDVVTTSL